MDPTEKISQFIVTAAYSGIPEKAVEAAKAAITDCLGVILAGAAEPSARICARLAREENPKGPASVFGQGFSTSPPMAALVNGTAAHALDYDDVSWSFIGHPSVSLVPTVFSLAETRPVTGQELLEAYAVGFEVLARLGQTMMPAHSAKGGWHSTGTLGTLGSTAAAAKLLRLDPDQTQMALGLASSMASGIMGNFGSMTKPLHAGLSARNGILAAKLAQKGFTANPLILERKRGFFDAYCRDLPCNLSPVDLLGGPFELAEGGVVIKPYPCGIAAHPAVDAVFHMMSAYKMPLDEIASIRVGVTQYTFDKMIYARPRTGLEGKFSMPYIVARALVDGEILLHAFTDQAIQNRQVCSLAEKIRMEVDSEIESQWKGGSRPCQVEISLKDGRVFRHRVDISRGNPELPLSPKELKAKFHDCGKKVLSEESRKKCWRYLARLEELKNLRPLCRLLRGKNGGESAGGREQGMRRTFK